MYRHETGREDHSSKVSSKLISLYEHRSCRTCKTRRDPACIRHRRCRSGISLRKHIRYRCGNRRRDPGSTVNAAPHKTKTSKSVQFSCSERTCCVLLFALKGFTFSYSSECFCHYAKTS